MLNELKKFNVRTILVLDYKERNGPKIFHSSAKLMPSDSDIDKAFQSMHQNIMTKINNYACKDWIALDVIIKHSISIYKLGVQLKTAKRKIRDFRFESYRVLKSYFNKPNKFLTPYTFQFSNHKIPNFPFYRF